MRYIGPSRQMPDRFVFDDVPVRLRGKGKHGKDGLFEFEGSARVELVRSDVKQLKRFHDKEMHGVFGSLVVEEI